MESKYLTKLEILNNTGYFIGLNPNKFYDVLKYNYESGNVDEKYFMDENADLHLDRYKNGIVQTNLIFEKINSIYNILLFFLILTILSVIINLIITINFHNELETVFQSGI